MEQNIPAKMVNMAQFNSSSLFGFGVSELLKISKILKKGATLIWFINSQIIDLLEPEYQDRTEQTADITHLGRNDAKQYPEKLLGYEALLDDVMDLDIPKPVGKWWLY